MDHHFIRHNKELFNLFLAHFREARKHQGMDDIHQMRVSIKKLRASWLFLEKASEGNWVKNAHYQLVKDLFSQAGLVRSLQVNLAMLNRYRHKYLDGYRSSLEQQLEAEKKRLVPVMKAFDLKSIRILNRELHAFAKDLDDDHLYEEAIQLLRNLFTQVRVLKSQLPDDDLLHRIRIRFKKVSEILVIMLCLKPSGRLERFLASIKSINTLTGRWHDDVELISSVEAYVQNMHPSERDHKSLNKFLLRLQLDKEKREFKVYEKLEALMSQGQLTERLRAL
jgi:CHAD domain-containing protein